MNLTEESILTVEDIQNIFSFSKNSAYKLMNSEGFPAIRINKRLFVSSLKLRDWIDSQSGHTYII